ncbi:MAG: hydrogenase maturation protease [Planctomycetota bacterium]
MSVEPPGDGLDALQRELRGVAPSRVALLAVGNRDRGDDGFGPAVADRLGDDLPGAVFDGGTAPENDLERVAEGNPEVVILMDAVHFGGEPGELRVCDPEELTAGGVSTHAGSLELSALFLGRACGARVLVLAAQPVAVGQGDELSEQMQRAAERVAEALRAILLG